MISEGFHSIRYFIVYTFEMADSKTTFQSTKALLDTTINEIIECLESKRTELSHLIDDYESDYDCKQSETLSDLNQLEELKKHTEGLAKNTLSDLQEKVIEDITLKISKLEFESRLPQLKINFDRDGLFSLVSDISILGYESGSLECDSDDTSEVVNGEASKGTPVAPTGRGKKLSREKKEKKGKKGEHELCDCGEDCEFKGDEPLDKKTRKLMKKLEKEEREEAKKEKKKEREDRKSSDKESPMGKKSKSKGKLISNLEVDSLIGSSDLTESL